MQKAALTVLANSAFILSFLALSRRGKVNHALALATHAKSPASRRNRAFSNQTFLTGYR